MAFTQVIKTLGSVMSGMKTAVDTWLSQNITNPSNPPLDRSLSLSNACAPADIVGEIKNELSNLEELNPNQFSGWQQGNAYKTAAGRISIASSTIRCRLLETTVNPLVKKVFAKEGYQFVWNACTLSNSIYTVLYNDATWTTEADLSAYTKDYLLVLAVSKVNGTDITPEEATENILFKTEIVDRIEEIEKELPSADIGENYLIDNMLYHRNVKVEKIGVLSYLQAFCIYDGKYYSANGTNIAEQDASFNVLRDVALNTGHCNSLQLGNNGKAYASGWDDNKVYIVDLTTLTVIDTIILPTTGYTTCAVDDINQIVYIFQRATNPITETSYNFIAYDYNNSQELYRRKTPPFSAMQSLDFYNGSIIVASGGSTAEMPNYFRIYNTSGDVVGEYVFGFLTREPEGICFDKETRTLYISDIAKNIYKITQ